MRLTWSDREGDAVIKAYQSSGLPMLQFATQYSKVSRRSPKAIEMFLHKSKMGGRIALKPSPYPTFDQPLVMQGDAVIITDLELPFHHAEFVNKVLNLGHAWGIKQLILGGDAVHNANLSSWEPAWKSKPVPTISEEAEAKLVEKIKRLPEKFQGELLQELAEIAPQTPDGLSGEMAEARANFHRLQRQFDQIDFVLGNHEGRLLRTFEAALEADELKRLFDIDNPKWRISPHYFSYLYSGGEKFCIEHPKNTRKGSAADLASKYQCHVVMGHSHHLNLTFDRSGKWFAIETGHCVDETKLEYVAHRHHTGHAHILGATIVRNGIPWLLHERVDWEALEGMQ